MEQVENPRIDIRAYNLVPGAVIEILDGRYGGPDLIVVTSKITRDADIEVVTFRDQFGGVRAYDFNEAVMLIGLDPNLGTSEDVTDIGTN